MLTLQLAVQDPDNFQALPVEDVAEILLGYLKETTPRGAHLGNLCVENERPISVATYSKARVEFDNDVKSRYFQERLAELRGKIAWPVAEAWQFLVNHVLLAPEPFQPQGFFFLTRRALAIESREDFERAIGQASESAKGKKKFGRAS